VSAALGDGAIGDIGRVTRPFVLLRNLRFKLPQPLIEQPDFGRRALAGTGAQDSVRATIDTVASACFLNEVRISISLSIMRFFGQRSCARIA
jgi:hypothetical protein